MRASFLLLVIAGCGGGSIGGLDSGTMDASSLSPDSGPGSIDAGSDGGSIAGDAGSDAGSDAAPIDGGTPSRYCEGFMPFPGARECMSSRDCMRFEQCLPPDVDLGCGIVMKAERACETDAACGTGNVCVEFMARCAEGLSTICSPACTTSSCAAEERCRSDGHCEAVPCTEGFLCAKNFVCTPGAGADAHGCIRRTCTMASDCDCGACTGGECRAGPSICTALPD